MITPVVSLKTAPPQAKGCAMAAGAQGDHDGNLLPVRHSDGNAQYRASDMSACSNAMDAKPKLISNDVQLSLPHD